MSKHKSVTIRVAKAANSSGKHKASLILNGKLAKSVHLSKTDISGGAIKNLLRQWCKLTADGKVTLAYGHERAVYENKGKECVRVSITRRKPASAAKPASARKVPSKAGLKAYQAFVKAQKAAGMTPKQALAAWKAARAGGVASKPKSKTKPKVTTKAVTKKHKINPKAATALARYRAFMKAQKAAGKTPKQALAAWKASKKSASKPAAAKPAKKPSKKPAVAAKPKTASKPKREQSAYNKFVAAYLAKHPNLGKDGIKAAAAAWNASGKKPAKKPSKKPAKKPAAVAAKPKSKKPAARGVLPNPGDILGAAAMRTLRRR